MTLKQHPLSAIFPALSKDEFDALVQDIKDHGQRSPVLIYENQALDGWHRVRACEQLKIKCWTVSYKGKDPAALVKSYNFHRRHLDASQRGLAVVRLAEWAESGRPKKGANLHPLLPSVAEMAATAGTSERVIQQSKRVEETGAPELLAAVKDGDVKAHDAQHVAAWPAEVQREVVQELKEKKSKPRKAKQPVENAPSSEPCARCALLSAELEDARAKVEKFDELIDELKTFTAIANDEGVKEMNILRQLLAQANRTRDTAMTTSAEKEKMIRSLERELKKFGWKGWKK